MENKELASTVEGLFCETAPFFKKLTVDKWDRIFAAFFLILGYLLWKADTAQYFDIAMAAFTLLYTVVVLGYCFLKKIPMTAEKIFWTFILLGIGLSMGFYGANDSLQSYRLVMLYVTAAYWTLGVTGGWVRNRTSSWVVLDIWNSLLALPFLNFFCNIRISAQLLKCSGKKRDWRMVILGLVISLPVLLIILPLLARADQGFEEMITTMLQQVDLVSFFLNCFMAFLFGGLMYGVLYGGAYRRHINEEFCRQFSQSEGKVLRILPDTAVHTLGFIVCVTYLLFMGLQGKYLFSALLGILPESFTYAGYARRGFFELCIIGAINAGLLFFMNQVSKTPRRENKGLILANAALSLLTLLLLVTAAGKLGLYIKAYGLTVKRVLSASFLLWMILVYGMNLVLQRKDIPIIRWAVFVGAVIFVLLCLLPVEDLVMWSQYLRL